MRFAAPCVILLTLASCNRNEHGLYPVSGNVTWQGEPAAGATVFLHRQGGNANKDHVTMGVVREDGGFNLVCGSLGNGALPGEYAVTIEWKQVIEQKKGAPRRSSDRLNGRYADVRRPRFHVTIKPERNELDSFDLTN